MRSKRKKDLLLRFYLVLFSIYFGLPIALTILNEKQYRVDIFHIGLLSTKDTVQVLVVIFVYMAFLLLGSRLRAKSRFRLSFSSSKVSWLEMLVYLFTGAYVVVFYILRFVEISNVGYAAYHAGELKYSKTFLVIICELVFNGLSFKLVSQSSKVRLYDLVMWFYLAMLMISGFRFPGLSGLVIWAILKRPGIFKLGFIKSLLLLPFFSLFPFLLILLQRVRNGIALSPEVLLKLFETGFRELIVQLNFTVDTLRVIVVNGTEHFINPFYGFVQLPLVAYYKTFGGYLDVNQRADLGAFSYAQTRFYRLDLFNDGVTFGNSVLSEMYGFLGILGVALAGFFHGRIFKILRRMRLEQHNSFYTWVAHYAVGTYLLKSVRGSSFDWIAMSLFLIVCYRFVHKFRLIIK